MTSVGKRSRRQARTDCRQGRHRFGSNSLIGGGIVRRMCNECGAISIDLTSVESPLEAGLFVAANHPEPSALT